MKSLIERIAAYTALIFLGVMGIAPFLYMFLLSTKRRIDIVVQVPPQLTFNWETFLRNYDEVLFRLGMASFIFNSAVVVGAATLIALILGVPAAYGFSRLRFRGNSGLANWILSLRFMPPIAVAVPLFLMMREIGLQNTYMGLILPYVSFSLPLVIWILIGFFDEIPREYEEAALIDGYTRFQAFVKVVLPQAATGIASTAIFSLPWAVIITTAVSDRRSLTRFSTSMPLAP